MRHRCYVLLRRRYDVPMRRRGEVPLRRLRDVPSRPRWVFYLRVPAKSLRRTERRRGDVATTSQVSGLWSNLLKETVITTTFYLLAEEVSAYTRKK